MRNNLFSVWAVSVLICGFLAASAAAQTISTVAGGGPPNGLAATTVPIGLPWSVIRDSAGNTYISDNLSNRIFEVDIANGNLSVIAGSTLNNYSGDGGPAVNATLSNPEGIALDPSNGALYIADTGNNVIRVVNTNSSGSITLFPSTPNQVVVPAGDIATVAGSLAPCTTSPCGDGGYATSAQLNQPAAVAVDANSNIYIADAFDSAIREVIQSTGKINTVAGTLLSPCSASPCGDGNLATSAQLNNPGGIYVDSAGNIYIADTNDNAIRVVNVSGAASFFGVTTISQGNIGTIVDTAMTACASPPNCGDGSPATGGQLNLPTSVYLTGSGSSLTMYIADSNNAVVREVVNTSPFNIGIAAGTYTPGFNGNSGQAIGVGAIQLNTPTSAFADSTGIFIADEFNAVIREVTGSTDSTVFGEALNHALYGDGGLATKAELQRPFGAALDSAGDVFIADGGNGVIREVNAKTGDISTVAGNGTLCQSAPCGDGAAATSAQLFGPGSVFVNGSGIIFIADTRNNAIRAVNTTASVFKMYAGAVDEIDIQPGDIATVVGNITVACPASPCGDGGSARSATLNNPSSVDLDKAGNIYVADTGDNVVRVANTQSSAITIAGVTIQPGTIETVAGNYTACSSATAHCGDGAAAKSAQLNDPAAVFVDGSGTIYIAEGYSRTGGDNRVRAVNTQASGSLDVAGVTIGAGDIAGIAGTGTVGYSGDTGAGTSADFNNPAGLFVDVAGEVFISDSQNSVIRRVNSVGNTQTVVGNGSFGSAGDGGPAAIAQLAHPQGLVGDSSANLYIADLNAWRVRKVTDIVATPATATPSPTSLTFSSQAVGTSSSAQTVTITNNAVGATLTISSVAKSGADAADFNMTNNCTTVAAGTNCSIQVTFAPTAAGTRTATLSITDNAAGSPQQVALTGTAVASFTLPKTGTLSPASVTAGSSATGTVTVTPGTGFSSAVAFICSVSPSSSPAAPKCSLNPTSVTPKGNGAASSTLTVTTTGANAMLSAPAIRRGNTFYAVWLFFPAMLISTAGMTASRRRKLLCYVLLMLALAGCIFLAACGGGSSGNNNNGGGGSGSGTPSGSYTITVSASTSGGTPQTETFILTVQ